MGRIEATLSRISGQQGMADILSVRIQNDQIPIVLGNPHRNRPPGPGHRIPVPLPVHKAFPGHLAGIRQALQIGFDQRTGRQALFGKPVNGATSGGSVKARVRFFPVPSFQFLIQMGEIPESSPY